MNKSIYEFTKKNDLASITTYQAGALQAAVHRLLQKQSDEILKEYGITKMQWMVIGAILDADSEGVRITDLTKSLGTTLPYLTNTINTLELKKIVVRKSHHKDNRAKLVAVHPSYIATCTEIELAMRRQLRSIIYNHVGEEDFLTYMKVLSQLYNTLHQNDKSV